MSRRGWIDLKLRNRFSATQELRAAVDRVADERRLDDGDRFDLKVAATEALTNALRDAAGSHVVEVTVASDENSIDIEVADRGAFSPRGERAHPKADAEGGRGIPLMIALVDEVQFARTGTGTRVRIRKRVA